MKKKVIRALATETVVQLGIGTARTAAGLCFAGAGVLGVFGASRMASRLCAFGEGVVAAVEPPDPEEPEDDEVESADEPDEEEDGDDEDLLDVPVRLVDPEGNDVGADTEEHTIDLTRDPDDDDDRGLN